MNWEAIAAIAELAGALGVIASLVYLARQIKQSNSTDKLNATLSLQSSYNETGGLFLRDGELISRGLSDLSQLNGEEQLKFAVIFHLYFGHIELVHSHDKKMLLDQDIVNRTYRALRFYLQFPGVQEWWKEAGRNTFSKAFIAFVEEQEKLEVKIKHGW